MLNKKAIDRLKAIPSEIQVVKFFHDRGLIISEMNAVPGHKAIMQNGHLDILVYLPADKRISGKTCQFGVDVKSHYKLYSNLFLETQTRPNKGVRYPSWAFCDYDESGKHNRYLMVVRDDENGVSFMKKVDTLIDNEKDEKENEEIIVRYCSEHMDIFTHTIEMYSYEDINTILSRTGGKDLKNRKDLYNKDLDIMYLIIDWKKWDKEFGRVELVWNRETNVWDVLQQGTKTLSPIRYNDISDMQLQDGTIITAADKEQSVMNLVDSYAKAQEDGLTYERLYRIMGVSQTNDPKDWERNKERLSDEIQALEQRREQLLAVLLKREKQ